MKTWPISFCFILISDIPIRWSIRVEDCFHVFSISELGAEGRMIKVGVSPQEEIRTVLRVPSTRMLGVSTKQHTPSCRDVMLHTIWAPPSSVLAE